MTHDTLKAFGYPDTIISNYQNWVVLLSPHQATLGALVIVHKSEATAFSEIDSASFAELENVIKDCEAVLGHMFSYQKINYMMLMMNDPHVHYHVIPRYDSVRSFHGLDFEDLGWPALPQLGAGHKLNDQIRAALTTDIKDVWSKYKELSFDDVKTSGRTV